MVNNLFLKLVVICCLLIVLKLNWCINDLKLCLFKMSCLDLYFVFLVVWIVSVLLLKLILIFFLFIFVSLVFK